MDGEAAGALRSAVKTLADGQDIITTSALRDIAGFDESVSCALEQELGPAPWQVGKVEWLVEALVEQSRANGEGLENLGLSGLRRLELAVDAALRQEDGSIAVCTVEDEPESEEPTEAEAAEVALASLEGDALRQLVEPILKARGAWPAGAETATRRLLGLTRLLMTLLSRTWRLARLRERRRDEVQEAPDVLEATLARLTTARKSLKERDWELADARNRLRRLEQDKAHQDQLSRKLQTTAEREALARTEAERRASEAALEARNEADAHAAVQHNDLVRRLDTVERELEHTRNLQRQSDELRLEGERRTMELERQLAESEERAKSLEKRLEQERRTHATPTPAQAAAPSASTLPSHAPAAAVAAAPSTESFKPASRSVTSAGAHVQDMQRAPRTSLGSNGLQRSASAAGSGSTSNANPQRPARRSGFGAFGDALNSVAARRQSRGNGGNSAAANGTGASSVAPTQTEAASSAVASTPTPPPQASSAQAAESGGSFQPRQAMPADIRSLGTLLTGGGLRGSSGGR
eukprot:TRINITY_DN21348_c0_g1_i2.p1 TRINITY_DN21348_c0_g1~~TRINITY_DN21348_c0_g1_i2.p1  ORF type:complete len:525 (-),score=115.10 TRINITY_DN21348_c0_g1_i2:102-1676(-)